MAFMINEDCISCGACEAECPNQAISEEETTYVIDPNKCTECVGSYPTQQCAEICPVSSCVADPNHKETREELLAKWKQLHPGETPKES
jgi:ferredoxin